MNPFLPFLPEPGVWATVGVVVDEGAAGVAGVLVLGENVIIERPLTDGLAVALGGANDLRLRGVATIFGVKAAAVAVEVALLDLTRSEVDDGDGKAELLLSSSAAVSSSWSLVGCEG